MQVIHNKYVSILYLDYLIVLNACYFHKHVNISIIYTTEVVDVRDCEQGKSCLSIPDCCSVTKCINTRVKKGKLMGT